MDIFIKTNGENKTIGQWLADMSEQDRKYVLSAVSAYSQRAVTVPTYETVSRDFGQLTAAEKQRFIKNICDGAAFGKQALASEVFDAAIKADLERRRCAQ